MFSIEMFTRSTYYATFEAYIIFSEQHFDSNLLYAM